jgi:hypothetical protein
MLTIRRDQEIHREEGLVHGPQVEAPMTFEPAGILAIRLG